MSRAAQSLLLAVLATGAPAPAPAEEASPTLEQLVDRYLQPFVEVEHLSGTVLIARHGRVEYERSFGLAHREHAVPNTPDTRFCVGSINKPMTLVVVARLLDAGRLDRDDTLAQYLPGFPRGQEITVEHLVGHAAGIPHRVTDPLDETRPQTPASMVGLAARRPLTFDPGTDSSYSSAGFSVLARVLELAAGQPYAALLAEHVLGPAGMESTSDPGSRPILEGRAASYFFDTEGFLNAPPGDISYLVGAGSVFSTPRDLLRMQKALLGGTYGTTAQKLLVREGGSLQWNGSAAGFRAYADHDGETGVSVVVASNLTSGALDLVREALPKLAAGETVPTPEAVVPRGAPVDPAVLRTFVGSYELRPGRALELRVERGRVLMDDWLLVPTSPTTLFSPQDYAVIEVVRDETGAVTHLDWHMGGQTFKLPRISGPADRP